MCQNDKNARAGRAASRYGFLFCFVFFIKYAKCCCPHGVSVTIVQGRYFDQKPYSVIFQISVIRLNILNWALYNQRPTDRSRLCGYASTMAGTGPATPIGYPPHDFTAMISLTSYSFQMFSTFFVVMVTL